MEKIFYEFSQNMEIAVVRLLHDKFIIV